jgi:hypothetical protein
MRFPLHRRKTVSSSQGRTAAAVRPAQGEPKRKAFWFSEFGVKPQTPAKDAREFARSANSAKSKQPSGFEKAKAEGFRPRKG